MDSSALNVPEDVLDFEDLSDAWMDTSDESTDSESATELSSDNDSVYSEHAPVEPLSPTLHTVEETEADATDTSLRSTPVLLDAQHEVDTTGPEDTAIDTDFAPGLEAAAPEGAGPDNRPLSAVPVMPSDPPLRSEPHLSDPSPPKKLHAGLLSNPSSDPKVAEKEARFNILEPLWPLSQSAPHGPLSAPNRIGVASQVANNPDQTIIGRYDPAQPTDLFEPQNEVCDIAA